MALNVVNGWFDEEFTMFGGEVLRGPAALSSARGSSSRSCAACGRMETFSIDGEFYKLKDATTATEAR